MRIGQRSLLAVLLCTAACTTLRSVPVASTLGASELTGGDRIEILTRDGERLALTVVSLSDEAIEARTVSGDLVTIGAEDIVELKARQFSAGKTAGLAALIAAGVLGAALDDAAFFPDGPAF